VHVVVKSLAAGPCLRVMIRAYGSFELDVVTCKRKRCAAARSVMPYSSDADLLVSAPSPRSDASTPMDAAGANS